MPVTPTYVPLGTITLASTDSEIVFSSIPATYRDLILIIRGTAIANTLPAFQLNGDTGSNYSNVAMNANVSVTESFSNTLAWGTITANTSTSGGYYQSQITWLDYSQTDKHKTSLIRSGQGALPPGGDAVVAFANRWASTSAITSIKIYNPYTGNSFGAGTTFSLYGVN